MIFSAENMIYDYSVLSASYHAKFHALIKRHKWCSPQRSPRRGQTTQSEASEGRQETLFAYMFRQQCAVLNKHADSPAIIIFYVGLQSIVI